MARRFGLVRQMERSALVFMLCVSACGPARHRAVPPAPGEPGELPEAHFKRVDEWRFVSESSQARTAETCMGMCSFRILAAGAANGERMPSLPVARSNSRPIGFAKFCRPPRRRLTER